MSLMSGGVPPHVARDAVVPHEPLEVSPLGHVLEVGDRLVHGEHQLQRIQFPLEDHLQQFGRRPSLAERSRDGPAPLLVMDSSSATRSRNPTKGSPCEGRTSVSCGSSASRRTESWNRATGFPGNQAAGEPT